jgi:glycosyltransferase involved in cell wall biosynthesis
MIVDVIIPAYNEEKSIAKVINDLPKDLIRHIIVGNNNSTDKTKEIAIKAGAFVVDEVIPGYGAACLKCIDYINHLNEKPDVIAFIDGDYSDYPAELASLLQPLEKDHYDLVIGSRVLGDVKRKGLTPQQIFGNWLATLLIRWIYGYRFTDLGPFRVIKYDKLIELKMEDQNYGWTVEMQVKAAKQKMRTTEVAVNYRDRIGVSKVSGTIKGTIMAGYKILFTIYKLI